jgi:hypothetical protein
MGIMGNTSSRGILLASMRWEACKVMAIVEPILCIEQRPAFYKIGLVGYGENLYIMAMKKSKDIKSKFKARR